jgi:hypothetical protein
MKLENILNLIQEVENNKTETSKLLAIFQKLEAGKKLTEEEKEILIKFRNSNMAATAGSWTGAIGGALTGASLVQPEYSIPASLTGSILGSLAGSKIGRGTYNLLKK